METRQKVKLATKLLLFSVIAIVPFLKTTSLFFPYISGKVYVFRFLIMLAFLGWVYLMAKGKECRPNFKNFLIIALVLFFLAQVLVSFFGVDPTHSFFSSIERADGVIQFGFWVLYFLMLISLLKEKNDWRTLFLVFITVALLISIYAWTNYKSQPRLHGFFGNPSYLAAFLLFAIGFSAIILERRFFQSYFLNGSIIVATAFFIVALIFTQTRGAYASLAGGVFLFLLLTVLFLRKENKKLALSCGGLLLVGLISLIVLFVAKDQDFIKKNSILSRVTEITDIWEVGAVRERILTWQIALRAFKERPVFGWGPENFGSAFNKYYDYRIGKEEPWFDRAHNQPLEILATGGIVLFSFYLFWLISAVYLIFKILKEKKVLSFVLFSIFLAYFLQGFFLFDTLPVYLGLFPFLGFLVFEYNSIRTKTEILEKAKEGKKFKKSVPLYILVPVACFIIFIIYATCFVPYKANALAFKFYFLTTDETYRGSKPFLEKSFAINSPYVSWELRKRAGWEFLSILEGRMEGIKNSEDIEVIRDIYHFITSELEKVVIHHPYNPQIYYILGRMYRFGFEKLGENDLDKAERIIREGFNYSELRVDYFNEMAHVLLLEGRVEEAEELVKNYVKRVTFYEYFPYLTLGHFYFVAGKYELAMEQYDKAIESGYKFYESYLEYSRYMLAAEETGEYQKVVDVAKDYLERWGPDADTFFNIAVGYFNLGEKEKAKEFFLKAVELDEKYEEYRPFFENF